MIDIPNSFLHTHRTSAALLLVAFLAGSGYLQVRVFPDSPMMAGSSWFLGLMPLFRVVGASSIGAMGVLFVASWIGLGVTAMVRFLRRRTTQRDPNQVG
jgi:hypothetical protein